MTDLRTDDQERVVSALYQKAEEIASKVVRNPRTPGTGLTQRLDSVFTSRKWSIPIMLALLATVFWITITGANTPSDLLTHLFYHLEGWLLIILAWFKAPVWLQGALILGMYRGLAWVVAVMLPPMAIFFPLFTLLEDFGYLPRVAFNLDHLFQRAGTHGKQALTMSMGFGCNAAGVIACRIIDSPRERLVAILTNNFVPCNGRFPILIVMGTIVASLTLGTETAGFLPTLVVLLGIGVAVIATFLVSKALTSTILQGEPSFFALELPPYRRPLLGQVLYRSFLDRTLFVLARAVVVAAPAGLLTWILANVSVGDLTLISYLTAWLEPLGRAIGLDGVILLAFILGLPANEIVIPIMLMIYLQAGTMLSLDGFGSFTSILVKNGWNVVTALNFIIFTIFHWPCATTLLTIKKETGRWYWVFLATIIPTLLGVAICFVVARIAGFFI
jgi:ferrous iron transport protein B